MDYISYQPTRSADPNAAPVRTPLTPLPRNYATQSIESIVKAVAKIGAVVTDITETSELLAASEIPGVGLFLAAQIIKDAIDGVEAFIAIGDAMSAMKGSEGDRSVESALDVLDTLRDPLKALVKELERRSGPKGSSSSWTESMYAAKELNTALDDLASADDRISTLLALATAIEAFFKAAKALSEAREGEERAREQARNHGDTDIPGPVDTEPGSQMSPHYGLHSGYAQPY